MISSEISKATKQVTFTLILIAKDLQAVIKRKISRPTSKYSTAREDQLLLPRLPMVINALTTRMRISQRLKNAKDARNAQ
jgi:hypothetical protein